jgi:hypothetical protein
VTSLPLTDLRADCSRCFGLCCVALPFAASADFALTKPAGVPCPNLGDGFACGIHDRLQPKGFAGCTVYDCLGAGQKVAQTTYAGVSWRDDPSSAAEMFEVFPVVRQLHEMLSYLAEGLRRDDAAGLHDQLRRAYDETDRLTRSSAADLLALDVPAHRTGVDVLLVSVSRAVRSAALPRGARAGRRRDRRGADLIGAALGGADLRGVDLRGAYLIAADLRGADLRGADLIGADLRDADVRGTDLSPTLFLNQMQVAAARGDDRTRLPGHLTRPTRWADVRP